ncbi:DNA recombination protein RmuC [Streptococcus entericus]|uniref:DNA recombination protein RmuC n=1 Tax=Streptococcus entericus TaxID=155680 RepID=UPI00036C1AA5|nr:DNA recombination protein RmuC [Streptococcus entericus]
MALLTLVMVVLVLLVLIIVLWQQRQQQDQLIKTLENQADNLSDQLTYLIDMAGKNQLLAQQEQLLRLQDGLYQQSSDLREALYDNLTASRNQTDHRLEQLQTQLTLAIKDLQTSNEHRLEDMRQTVSEKLDQTLNQRLQTSFETVSKQLESVNQGLGEMKTVARDVGSLSKVLSGSKTRGILGEIQLAQIIEDMLTPSQYEREFATVSGSSERVEYAIKLPGQASDTPVYLPIDAKFPLEDYYRLEEAYELADRDGIDQHRKALLASVKRFAKDIQKKYLNPPETTQFGILFLPTEGLYAEVVRQADFFDRLRREEQILVAGPSTLSALLNALSVGFKTLNIQKNADDISKVLGNVKTEFGKFSGLLSKAQKQLNTASRTLDSVLTTRTNAIVRALTTIEAYQDSQTQSLLDLPLLEDEEDNED